MINEVKMLLDEKAQLAEDLYIMNLNRLGLDFDIKVSRVSYANV